MKLTKEALQKDRNIWESKNYILPKFDIDEVEKNTKENPSWVHFGAGNIFKSFLSNAVQKLLNDGDMDKGIIVAEGFDYEIIEKINKPYDNLSILVTLKVDGSTEKTVIASIVESLVLDTAMEKEYQRLKEIFTNKSLQMVSFTITEKGYSLVDAKGDIIEIVKQDFLNGPKAPVSYIGKLTALCYERYKNGKMPLALVSMDNCSDNGIKLYNAVSAFARAWTDNDLVDKEFYDYVTDVNSMSFPCSMIDKITPRPDDGVKNILINDGFVDANPVITSKNTYIAPFVNAEACEYLVIEDLFPNGRPPLEKAGIIFTTRCTVDCVEKMKVCTCLNPLHTALAIFGCLLSYKSIAEEMKDADLRNLVEKIGYIEGLPVVVDPKIINPKDFIDEVLTIRFPNPFMPDTPQRIATDTSQKLAIRFGETIKAYDISQTLKTSDLKFIPLVLAGYLRYLMAVDDNLETFELSPDPKLESLCNLIKNIPIGYDSDLKPFIAPILSDESIFGVDLYKVDLGDKIEMYFKELISGKNAVRTTLKKYLIS